MTKPKKEKMQEYKNYLLNNFITYNRLADCSICYKDAEKAILKNDIIEYFKILSNMIIFENYNISDFISKKQRLREYTKTLNILLNCCDIVYDETKLYNIYNTTFNMLLLKNFNDRTIDEIKVNYSSSEYNYFLSLEV